MSSIKKTANAVGGKTARACDGCICKRARWYCAADDAFLCQACDASVHSANSLAQRHERVRLKTSSIKPTEKPNNLSIEINNSSSLPTWDHGFCRKPRTPRHGKPMISKSTKAEEEAIGLMNTSVLPLVPEIGCDEISPDDESEEQLLYRVPIFDPFVAEFCTSIMPNEVPDVSLTDRHHHHEDQLSTYKSSKGLLDEEYGHVTEELENLSGLNLPSDMELTEFAADVETLLGRGLDEDSFGIKGLGLLDSNEENYCCFGSTNTAKVKEEEEEEEEVDEELEAVVTCHMDQEFDMSKDTLDLNFDYESPTTEGEEEDVKVVNNMTPMTMMTTNDNKMTKSLSLRLNYESVMDAWASQGSPWTTADQPQSNPDNYWPDCVVPCHTDQIHHHGYGDLRGVVGVGVGGGGGQVGMGGDGGREARVSRYKEKRRTRLFSKKIRYEVRKLNAEKRPRMKGRFVKRPSSSSSSFMATTTTNLPF